VTVLKPLGLPPGSVRALLLIALGVRAVLDLREPPHTIEVWLGVALVLAAAAYFSSRSSSRWITVPASGSVATTVRPRAPLWLPAGTIRLIALALAGYGAWLWYHHHDVSLGGVPTAWVLGAFALGIVLRWIGARARRPDDAGTGWFWHLQALVALGCAAGLVAIGLHGVPANLPSWIDPLLAAVVVYYFGSR
jgi:hypothetical protein